MKVLIVDDEPLARYGLRREVQDLPGFIVTGECASCNEAVEAIVKNRPDVVLLDIQLGRGNAFDIIEQIGIDAMPPVIFITAYDRHAIRAFEVHALDYLLKPVDPARLRETLDRAGQLLAPVEERPRVERLQALLDEGDEANPAGRTSNSSLEPLERLVVREGDRLLFVDVDHIEWVEAFGNRVRLHVARRTHLLRTTMTRLHQRLGENRFIRIRRSTLVNVRAVTAAEQYGKGSYTLTLRTGERLTSSRYHAAAMRDLLRPLR